MAFHNIRDKFGRFTCVNRKKRSTNKSKAVKRPLLKPEAKSILNVFLLDDTVSMSDKVAATVVGFNKVLSDAREADKATNILSTDLLLLFGETGHFQVEDKVVSLCAGYNLDGLRIYYPTRRATALWWATIKAIHTTELKLTTLAKGTKVILTIFTDGDDNNSSIEEWREAKKLVQKKQQEGWVINFIGAGDRAFVEQAAGSIGIFASNTMNYANTNIGTATAFASFSGSNVSYRSKVARGVATADGFFAEEK